MASLTAKPTASDIPPSVEIRMETNAYTEITQADLKRVVNGAETLVRSQPTTGNDGFIVHDYEAPYDTEIAYRVTGQSMMDIMSSWTGTTNASSSVLKAASGSTIAANLLYDPMLRTSGIEARWNSTLTRTSTGLTVTADPTKTQSGFNYGRSDDNGAPTTRPSVCPILQPGDYAFVFKARKRSSKATSLNINLHVWSTADFTLLVKNESSAGNMQTDWVTYRKTFTITKEGFPVFYLQPGSGSGAWGDGSSFDFSSIALYSMADDATLSGLDVPPFSGDSYPNGMQNTIDMTTQQTKLQSEAGWLIHPANPAKSVEMTRGMVTGFEGLTRRSNAVRHDVLRSHYPIYTIPSSRHSREFNLKLRTKSWDQENMLDQLLDDQIPILFNPLPSYGLGLNPMFLQVMDMQDERYAQMSYTGRSGPAQWRDWTLPCVEVDSPAVVQQAVGWTYADLLDENRDYARILTDYATYADLQAHEKRTNV